MNTTTNYVKKYFVKDLSNAANSIQTYLLIGFTAIRSANQDRAVNDQQLDMFGRKNHCNKSIYFIHE